jgi:O-antigen ligase
LGEWWLAGTDFTKHWMPTGVSWNPNHTDITNYYLHLGVIGGLPLMLTLVAIICLCFRNLLKHIGIVPGDDKPHEFTLWCLGTALFAHALSFVSISYFDQMYVLFYLLVGGIAGIQEYVDDAVSAEEENETV